MTYSTCLKNNFDTFMPANPSISVILPTKNEADNIGPLLQRLQSIPQISEILVINDGSTDNTAKISAGLGARVITHPYSMGNGAAVKTGARNAKGDLLIFMDADGQHDPEDIPKLLAKLDEGYDMVVGARHLGSHATLFRKFANRFYNKLATFMTGFHIEDLTSGFRAVRADKFRKFLYLLPNGFSYPTTSTMAFFRSGFPIAYIPIFAGQRQGKSHIRFIKDGIRFFIIILKIGALFSPMRLFLPISSSIFVLGMSYYSYTYLTAERFTNMGALLLLSSLIIFMMGILCELISALHYRNLEPSDLFKSVKLTRNPANQEQKKTAPIK